MPCRRGRVGRQSNSYTCGGAGDVTRPSPLNVCAHPC
jgi:hypothetical protein